MPNWPHLFTRFVFDLRRVRRQGTSAIAYKLSRHIAGLGLWVFLLPLTCALHLAGYRRVNVFTDRIGHLALEPDCLLKEQSLGLIRKRRWFMLAPAHRIANGHLLHYWEAHIRVVRGPWLCFLLASTCRWGLMSVDVRRYALATDGAQAAYHIYTQWGTRAPLLTLFEDDRRWGRTMLAQLGLPEDAWFACVHVREPGFSPIDEELHAHRNGSIEAVIPAIRRITERGGWVVRIGDPTMTALPPMDRVIDYAHHSLKSERMDIILSASARFVLGNTSGIALVSTVFGVPCALANMIPLAALGFGARDISMPKLLWSRRLGRMLTFEEILGSTIANFGWARLYEAEGIDVRENDAEDLCLLVGEMLDDLDSFEATGTIVRLQPDRFRRHLKPSHYSFGSCASISARFVERHRELWAHERPAGAVVSEQTHRA